MRGEGENRVLLALWAITDASEHGRLGPETAVAWTLAELQPWETSKHPLTPKELREAIDDGFIFCPGRAAYQLSRNGERYCRMVERLEALE